MPMHHTCERRSAVSQLSLFRGGQVCAAALVLKEAKNRQEAKHKGQPSSAAACSDPRWRGGTVFALLDIQGLQAAFWDLPMGLVCTWKHVIRSASEQPGRRAQAWPGDQRQT